MAATQRESRPGSAAEPSSVWLLPEPAPPYMIAHTLKPCQRQAACAAHRWWVFWREGAAVSRRARQAGSLDR
eukprot:953668-Prymnesium_polylepis.1